MYSRSKSGFFRRLDWNLGPLVGLAIAPDPATKPLPRHLLLSLGLSHLFPHLDPRRVISVHAARVIASSSEPEEKRTHGCSSILNVDVDVVTACVPASRARLIWVGM